MLQTFNICNHAFLALLQRPNRGNNTLQITFNIAHFQIQIMDLTFGDCIIALYLGPFFIYSPRQTLIYGFLNLYTILKFIHTVGKLLKKHFCCCIVYWCLLYFRLTVSDNSLLHCNARSGSTFGLDNRGCQILVNMSN